MINICLLLAILRPSILIFCVFWAACNCFCFAILIQGTWSCDGALFYMWAAAEPDSGNAPGIQRIIVFICFLHLVMNNMYLMWRILVDELLSRQKSPSVVKLMVVGMVMQILWMQLFVIRNVTFVRLKKSCKGVLKRKKKSSDKFAVQFATHTSSNFIVFEWSSSALWSDLWPSPVWAPGL